MSLPFTPPSAASARSASRPLLAVAESSPASEVAPVWLRDRFVRLLPAAAARREHHVRHAQLSALLVSRGFRAGQSNFPEVADGVSASWHDACARVMRLMLAAGAGPPVGGLAFWPPGMTIEAALGAIVSFYRVVAIGARVCAVVCR